jgi:hypothetical protein
MTFPAPSSSVEGDRRGKVRVQFCICVWRPVTAATRQLFCEAIEANKFIFSCLSKIPKRKGGEEWHISAYPLISGFVPSVTGGFVPSVASRLATATFVAIVRQPPVGGSVKRSALIVVVPRLLPAASPTESLVALTRNEARRLLVDQ